MKKLVAFISLIVALAAQEQVPLTSLDDAIGHHSRGEQTPVVQHDFLPWYKNWLTCAVCNGWAETFKTLATENQYKKALKGFLWLGCSTQFPQSFCKFTVENLVEHTYSEIFELMLHKNFICGYIFDFCGATAGEVYYQKLNVSDWQELYLASKPAAVANNDYLDYLYDLSSPDLDPPTFSVLWLSDIELDMFYTEGASTSCDDEACCHAKDVAVFDADKASKYGSKKCYHSLDGFKRMIDAINYYNTSNSPIQVQSIVYGGSSGAPVPDLATADSVKEGNAEVIKYIREKNPKVGLYYALGPNDLWPPNFQSFAASGDQKLIDLDAALNTATTDDTYSSISDESANRDKFKEYGYYSVNNFIYSILKDSLDPNQAASAIVSPHIQVIFINSNVCHNKNLALMREESDPGGQLAYLKTKLEETENAQNQRAWIIGNLAPGNKHCNSRWAQRYNTLIERYQKIVVFQQFGHDEKEYFQLQYPSEGPSNPFGVVFQGGKATTLNQAPRFKVIDFDANWEIPQKITVYEYNIELAAADPNAQPEDLLLKVKTYPDDFGMSSLRPSDFQALSGRIKSDQATAVAFYNKMCANDDCYITECDATCRSELGCMLDNASQQDILACRGQGIQDREFGYDYLLSQMQNPWVQKFTKS